MLRIGSGAVRVSLEEDSSITAETVDATAAPIAVGGVTAGLNLVLDGVASRVR